MTKPSPKSRASKKKKGNAGNTRSEIRFKNPEHHDLVREAAKKRGLTMNGWLVDVTLSAARKELRD